MNICSNCIIMMLGEALTMMSADCSVLLEIKLGGMKRCVEDII